MDSLTQARERLARAVALDPGLDAAREALKAVEAGLSRRNEPPMPKPQ